MRSLSILSIILMIFGLVLPINTGKADELNKTSMPILNSQNTEGTLTILEVEDGEGDGVIKSRSAASRGKTLWLHDGESVLLSFEIRIAGEYQLFVRYSNDNFGSLEKVHIAINGNFFGSFDAQDTGDFGYGWNRFKINDNLELANFEVETHDVELSITEGDGFGVEIDQLLIIAADSRPNCNAITVSDNEITAAIKTAVNEYLEPWQADFGMMYSRAIELLGCKIAPFRQSLSTEENTDQEKTSPRSSIKLQATVQQGGRSGCLASYCSHVQYCGPNDSERNLEWPFGIVSDAINRSCYDHDRCYDDNCPKWHCYFSKQGVTDACDNVFLNSCKNLASNVLDKIYCSIADELTNLDRPVDCLTEPCENGTVCARGGVGECLDLDFVHCAKCGCRSGYCGESCKLPCLDDWCLYSRTCEWPRGAAFYTKTCNPRNQPHDITHLPWCWDSEPCTGSGARGECR